MTGRHIEKPWVIIAANLMHFPQASSQNKYLIVFQDLFMKWIDLKLIREATRKAVAAGLEEIILVLQLTFSAIMAQSSETFWTRF